MDYKLLRPFGPTIYHSTMREEMMDLLREIAEENRASGADYSKRLAGNIKKELLWTAGTSIQKNAFYHEVLPHIKTYFQAHNERFASHLLNRTEYDADVVENKDQMFEYRFSGEPWINYQKATEFNPTHSHTGILSSVLYIDVPEVIAEESTHSTSNMACAGQIEFHYGPNVLGVNGTHKIVPKTGDILLFHAELNHSVYPFKSDVERISMSFNVSNIGKGSLIPTETGIKF
tara:strand:- start:387 stop:1082 length:696 start_codon:yes stop_codon:yes gene_type:complete